MSLESIFDNPHFGKLVKKHSSLQNFLKKHIEHVAPEIAAQAPKVRADFDSSGNLIFISDELNHTYTRHASETMADFRLRVFMGSAKPGVDISGVDYPNRDIPLSAMRAQEIISGGKDNARTTADSIAKMKLGNMSGERRFLEALVRNDPSLTIKYRTFEPGIKNYEAVSRLIYSFNDADQVEDAFGFLIPDADKLKSIEIFRNGKRLNLESIFSTIGIDPFSVGEGGSGVIFKRMTRLMNQYNLGQEFEAGKLGYVSFDPGDLFKTDAFLQQNLASVIESEKIAQASKLAGMTPAKRLAREAEIAREITEKLTDGISFMSYTQYNNFIRGEREQIKLMEKNLRELRKGGGFSVLEIREAERNIEKRKSLLERAISSKDGGRSFNLTMIGGVDTFDPSQPLGQFKGDVFAVPDHVAFNLARQNPEVERAYQQAIKGLSGPELTQASSNFISDLMNNNMAFVSRADKKMDLGLTRGSKIPAFMGLSPYSPPETLYSNTLTLSNFGNIVNPTMPDGSSLLDYSLTRNLDSTMEEIASGKISSRLRAIVNKFSELDRSLFSTDEDFEAARRVQKYAQRVEEYLKSGVDISSNDAAIRDIMKVVEAENFRARRFGVTFDVNGRPIPDLGLRVPLVDSTRTHFSPSDFFGKVGQEADIESYVDMPNMSIRVNSAIDDATGRATIRAVDTIKLSMAWGGSDFDDSLGVTYRYDEKAKRLLAHVVRDPNAIGEYAWLDADITRDKNFMSKKMVYTDITGVRSEVSIAEVQIRRKKQIKQVLKLKEQIERSADPSVLQERLMSAVDALSSTNKQLDQYFSGYEGVAKVDIHGMYRGALNGLDDLNPVYAPNDSRVTAELLSRYEGGSFSRGYVAMDASTPEAAMNSASRLLQEITEESSGVKGSLVFEQQRGYRDYTRLGYFSIADLDSVQAPSIPGLAGEAKNVQRLARDVGSLEELSRIIAKTDGVLGQTINTASVIESFIDTHTRSSYGLPEAQIKRIRDIIRSNGGFSIVERESLIDAITKTGDESIITKASYIGEQNLVKLGRIIAQMHSEGIAVGEVGLDAMLAGQRLSLGSQISSVVSGYKDFFGETDPMFDGLSDSEILKKKLIADLESPVSSYASQYERILSQREALKLKTEQLQAQARGSLVSSIDEYMKFEGQAFTPEEIARSQEFINDFYNNRRAFRLGESPDEVRRLLAELSGNAEAFNLMGDDTIALFGDLEVDARANYQSMKKFQDWGLLSDSEALRRQILAIARTASEAQLPQGVSSLDPLLSLSPNQGAVSSVSTLASDALSKMDVIARTRQAIQTAEQALKTGDTGVDLLNLFNSAVGGVEGAESQAWVRRQILRSLLGDGSNINPPGVHRQQLSSFLVNAAKQLGAFGEGGFTEATDALARGESVPQSVIYRIRERLQDPAPSLFDDSVDPVFSGPAPGSARNAARAASDAASQGVTTGKSHGNMIRKIFGSGWVDDLTAVPGVKKMTAAAAIFAGIGIVHQFKDRSIADMYGPPLLPGGSFYEPNYGPHLSGNYEPQMPVAQQGYTYTVRSNGHQNPAQLEAQIGGQMNGRINSRYYNSRQTTSTQHQSSMALLNSLYE